MHNLPVKVVGEIFSLQAKNEPVDKALVFWRYIDKYLLKNCVYIVIAPFEIKDYLRKAR